MWSYAKCRLLVVRVTLLQGVLHSRGVGVAIVEEELALVTRVVVKVTGVVFVIALLTFDLVAILCTKGWV